MLHFVSDEDNPAGIVVRIAAALAPGSLIAISHLTGDYASQAITASARAYNARVPIQVHPRTGPVISGRAATDGQNSPLAAVLDTRDGKVFVKGLPSDHRLIVTQAREAAAAPLAKGRHRNCSGSSTKTGGTSTASSTLTAAKRTISRARPASA